MAELRRLKKLEAENAKPEKLLAEAYPGNATLKDVVPRKWSGLAPRLQCPLAALDPGLHDARIIRLTPSGACPGWDDNKRKTSAVSSTRTLKPSARSLGAGQGYGKFRTGHGWDFPIRRSITDLFRYLPSLTICRIQRLWLR